MVLERLRLSEGGDGCVCVGGSGNSLGERGCGATEVSSREEVSSDSSAQSALRPLSFSSRRQRLRTDESERPGSSEEICRQRKPCCRTPS
eukprot:scaffold238590_cov30-Tisochrysis_lutea.AAC.2